MDGDIDVEDDERSIELSSITAIFPELVIDAKDPFSAFLELPVSPNKPISVVFPVLTSTASNQHLEASLTNLSLSRTVSREQGSGQAAVDLRQISHFPPLQIRLHLPSSYPATAPPRIQLSSALDWIPVERLRGLETQVRKLWEDVGHDQVVYDYIDLLQQAAEDAFGLAPKDGSPLNLPNTSEVAILDYDLKTKQKKFDDSTFDCGVCLEPKKGVSCYRLRKCGHVFCVDCLQSFYDNCITEGDVYSVKCLTPDCEKKSDGPRQQISTLEASELIQIPIEQEQVQRYVKLLRKKRLESNKDTIYCPRKWCQGPAKPNKPPETNPLPPETEIPASDPKKKPLPPPSERLCVCEDCGFAFCSVCASGWHGEFAACFPRSAYELTAEEHASEAYLRKHSQLCPTCRARCQKTMGCNHMECYQCKTHFCYLCRAFLDRENPYKHFNTPILKCYMQLWVMEEGDGEPGTNDGWRTQFQHDHEDGGDEDEGDVPVDPNADLLMVQARQPIHEVQAPAAPQPPPPAPVPPGQRNAARWRPRRAYVPQVGVMPGHGLQRFLAMAAADEEDDWDSDELDDIDGI